MMLARQSLAILLAVATGFAWGTSRGQERAQNAGVLHGGQPFKHNVLPDLPPSGFYAWCNTPRGVCMVQGNAPIAPGSLCSCGDYSGRTV